MITYLPPPHGANPLQVLHFWPVSASMSELSPMPEGMIPDTPGTIFYHHRDRGPDNDAKASFRTDPPRTTAAFRASQGQRGVVLRSRSPHRLLSCADAAWSARAAGRARSRREARRRPQGPRNGGRASSHTAPAASAPA